MVPTYIVLVALCLVISEAKIFIGDCSYGFCEQECTQFEKLQMECYCRKGHVLKADGRKCLKSDDTEDNDAGASGDDGSGQDIEVNNCDNEDGDCDTTLKILPSSGDGEEGSGVEATRILPSISAILPNRTVSVILPTITVPSTDPFLDNIPHILSFSFAYPTAKCIAKLDGNPDEFRKTIRYQIASSASMDEDSLTEFHVSCGSLDVELKLVEASKLSVADGVKKIKNLVSNGKLDITIDGHKVKPVTTSFASIIDPAYSIPQKVIKKTVERPIQIVTASIEKTVEKLTPIVPTSTSKVKTITTKIHKTNTSMEASYIKSTQTTKTHPSARDIPILFTDKYLASTLSSTLSSSMDAKKATQTPSSIQTLLSIIEGKDIVQGFVTSIVNSTQAHSTPSTTQFKRITSYGGFAGQTSVRPSVPSLKPMSTSVQEILPLLKPSSTSVHKSFSTSLPLLKSISTPLQEILPPLKPSSTSVHKSLPSSSRDLTSLKTSTSKITDEIERFSKPIIVIYNQVPKRGTNMTSVLASKNTILVVKTTKVPRAESASEKLIPQQPRTVKSGMDTTTLKGITQSSSILLVSSVSDGTFVKTSKTSKETFSTMATSTTTTSTIVTATPLEVVGKHVVATSIATDLRPKQTSSVSKPKLETSIVGIKTGPYLVSTATKSSVVGIVKSSKIKLDDSTMSSRTTSSVVSSTPSGLFQPVGQTHTPVVIGSSSFAFKETTKLRKYTIQTSKPAVLSETMQSTHIGEIQSSPSKVATEGETDIKVVTETEPDIKVDTEPDPDLKVIAETDPDLKVIAETEPDVKVISDIDDIKVISLESSDPRGSRDCRLLANSYALLVLTSFITYLLVLH